MHLVGFTIEIVHGTVCIFGIIFSFRSSSKYFAYRLTVSRKYKHIVTFLGLQPVIWFLFLGTKRQGHEFHHLPPHNAETVMNGPAFLFSTRFRVIHKDLSPLLGLHMLSSYEPSSALQSSLLENYKIFMGIHLQIVTNRSDLTFFFFCEFRKFSAGFFDFLTVLMWVAAPVKSDEK